MKFQRLVVSVMALGVLGGCAGNELASATNRTFGGELMAFNPTTWVDPDGCEHWIFDTGAEGYMTPKLSRDGRPVCSAGGSAAFAASAVPGALTFGDISRDGPTSQQFTMSTDAYFAPDSAGFTLDAFTSMDNFFRYLDELGVTEIEVVGHTSSIAADGYNQRLSLQRAQAVAEYAREYGITGTAEGRGETEPVADNATPQGRAMNRRVVITSTDAVLPPSDDVGVQSGRTGLAMGGANEGEQGVDRGFDAHPLSQMVPAVWIDPLGCEHWVIDDGVEGYLSNRLNRDGTPRCG